MIVSQQAPQADQADSLQPQCMLLPRKFPYFGRFVSQLGHQIEHLSVLILHSILIYFWLCLLPESKDITQEVRVAHYVRNENGNEFLESMYVLR